MTSIAQWLECAAICVKGGGSLVQFFVLLLEKDSFLSLLAAWHKNAVARGNAAAKIENASNYPAAGYF